MSNNYYKTLGIPIDATLYDIEVAYDAMQRLEHSPEEQMELRVAYLTLLDPVERLNHDQELQTQAQQNNLVMPNVKEQVAKAQALMAKYKALYAQIEQAHRTRLRDAILVGALSGIVLLLGLLLINPQDLWMRGGLLWLGEMGMAFFLFSFLGLPFKERLTKNLINLSWRWGLYFGLTAYIANNPRMEVIQSDFLYEALPLALLTFIPHLFLSIELIRSQVIMQYELDKKQFFKIHGQKIDRAATWVDYHRYRRADHWTVYSTEWDSKFTTSEVFWGIFLIVIFLSPYLIPLVWFMFSLDLSWVIVGVFLVAQLLDRWRGQS